jgi:hypothetical protein
MTTSDHGSPTTGLSLARVLERDSGGRFIVRGGMEGEEGREGGEWSVRGVNGGNDSPSLGVTRVKGVQYLPQKWAYLY